MPEFPATESVETTKKRVENVEALTCEMQEISESESESENKEKQCQSSDSQEKRKKKRNQHLNRKTEVCGETFEF